MITIESITESCTRIVDDLALAVSLSDQNASIHHLTIRTRNLSQWFVEFLARYKNAQGEFARLSFGEYEELIENLSLAEENVSILYKEIDRAKESGSKLGAADNSLEENVVLVLENNLRILEHHICNAGYLVGTEAAMEVATNHDD